MRQINFATFDLNLILVFEAIFQESSVTEAGARLGLSQSAVSAALATETYAMANVATSRGAASIAAGMSVQWP
ncbi:MAG: LysR family transcriptional regulator, partial [Rhizobium pusense]|nr:LysR family transcriptional regulator [Agrobacterium pusense]